MGLKEGTQQSQRGRDDRAAEHRPPADAGRPGEQAGAQCRDAAGGVNRQLPRARFARSKTRIQALRGDLDRLPTERGAEMGAAPG